MLRDPKLQDVLTVEPETVTKTSTLLLDHPERDPFLARQRTRGPQKTFTPEVESKQFHPAVWQAALKLAGGDPYRLVAYSLTNIQILNKPRPRGTSIWAPEAA